MIERSLIRDLNIRHDIKNKKFDKQFKKMKMKTLNRNCFTCKNYYSTRWLLFWLII